MAKKKKKKLSKTEKRERRLHRGWQWVLTYTGLPESIVNNYHKKFHVDRGTAKADLLSLGVEFTQDYLDHVQKEEQERLHKLHYEKRLKNREKRKSELLQEIFGVDSYEDIDYDSYVTIAGYTSGGAPYGITWDEMDIDPIEYMEELLENE